MAEDSKSANFVLGISFHLILALLIPGALAAFFFAWLFGSNSVLRITGDKEFTLTNGIAFSLIFGLILTPCAFFVERVWQYIKGLWSPPESPNSWENSSVTILRGEKSGKVGWYFYQVWGQLIMHWNIGVSLLIIAIPYLLNGFLIKHSLVLRGPITALDIKTVVLAFTIIFNLKVSSYFAAWHQKNIAWVKQETDKEPVQPTTPSQIPTQINVTLQRK